MLLQQGKDALKQSTLREVEENMTRFWVDLGTEMHYSTEKTQLFSNISHPLFNAVLRSNIPSAIASKRVREIIQQFEKRKLPFSWFVYHHSRPENLCELLKERGMVYQGTWMNLVHDLEGNFSTNIVSEPISVQAVTNYDAMMIWAINFSECMNVPFKEVKKYTDLFAKQGVKPYRHFLVSQQGSCIGVCSLYFLSDIVGVYNFTVKKSTQQKGVGASVINYLLKHSQKINAKRLIFHAPLVHKNKYIDRGFQHVSNFEIYYSV